MGDAAGELLDRVRPLAKLIGHVLEADDRPGHQLGKHGHVAPEVDGISDRRGVAAKNVDRIAHRLERVEADAQRQRHLEHAFQPHAGQAERLHQGCVVEREKVEVLEEPQQREVGDHRDRQRPALTPGPRLARRQQRDGGAPRRGLQLADERQAAEVVDERRDEHQDHEQRIRPAVENVADRRERQVLQPARAEVVQHQRCGQKVEQKQVRTENHDGFPTSSPERPAAHQDPRCAQRQARAGST